MNRKFTRFVASLVFSIAAVSSTWSQRDGAKFSNWGALVHLPPPINSEFDDQAAVLSKDEKTMYFSSNRPGSINGSRDIWVSTRKNKNAPWREPIHLGPVINSPGTELVRSITSDGMMTCSFLTCLYPARSVRFAGQPRECSPSGNERHSIA